MAFGIMGQLGCSMKRLELILLMRRLLEGSGLHRGCKLNTFSRKMQQIHGRLREIERAENENKEKTKQNSLEITNNTNAVQLANEYLAILRGSTSKTAGEVDQLGQTAGASINYMNNAMNIVRQMLNPSGGGGSGCRTFGSSERVQAGSDIVYEGPERGNAVVKFLFKRRRNLRDNPQ